MVSASAAVSNRRMNKMKPVTKRLNKFVDCAKEHGVDARWCHTKSSHYSLWLSRGEDKATPIFFSSSSGNRAIALYERQLFTKGMRSLGIDIDKTGLSLSFYTSRASID